VTIERIFLAFLLWLVCFVALPLQIGGNEASFEPVGPDAFMRLERVNTLVETGNWHDNFVQRAGSDGGADIHWTRPMDVMILAVAGPLLPFMETTKAIEVSGIVFPILMSLALVFLCLWAVQPLMQGKNILLIVILLAVQPIIQNYMGIGRVDHHALLAVVTAALLGSLVRVSLQQKSARYALWAGCLSGFGLWVSLEFMIVYIPVVIGLGACWLIWGKAWRQANRDFAVFTFVLVVFGIAVDVPMQDWVIDRYDRISSAQTFLVLCPLIFWTAIAPLCEGREMLALRLGAACLYGAFCFLVISLLFPSLFVGPLAEADPRIGPIWHDNVSEMAPLTNNWRRVILYCLLPFSAILYWCAILKGRIRPTRQQMSIWMILVLLCTAIMTLAHLRAGLYLSVAAVIAAGPLLEDLLIWANRRFNGWRKGATGVVIRAAVILGPFLLALVVGSIAKGPKSSEAVAGETREEAKCDRTEISEFLSSDIFLSSDKPLKFINNIDFGPELLYRTRHHFLAVPYHRNGDSIYDTYDLLTATEYDQSRALLDKYEISYILLCFDSGEKSYYHNPENRSSLYNRLLEEDLPDGIISVEAPQPWRLFQYKVLSK